MADDILAQLTDIFTPHGRVHILMERLAADLEPGKWNTLFESLCDVVDHAVAKERDACAEIVESYADERWPMGARTQLTREIAEGIRARSEVQS